MTEYRKLVYAKLNKWEQGNEFSKCNDNLENLKLNTTDNKVA